MCVDKLGDFLYIMLILCKNIDYKYIDWEKQLYIEHPLIAVKMGLKLTFAKAIEGLALVIYEASALSPIINCDQ